MDLFRIFRPSSQERRQATRIPFDMVICYEKETPVRSALPEDVYVKCMDLSMGGILFESPDLFREGSILKVSLPIPGSVKPLITEVEIIRVRQTDKKQFEMGGKFCGLDDESKKTVGKLVSCYTKNTSPDI